MNMKQIISCIFSMILLGCENNIEADQVRWNDPISGDSIDFDQTRIDEWKILTAPDKSSKFILLNKNNGPTLSYDSLGPWATVMIHQPSASGQSSIDVADLDNDGIFDSITFFSSTNEVEFIMYEAKLIGGNWDIIEHKKE